MQVQLHALPFGVVFPADALNQRHVGIIERHIHIRHVLVHIVLDVSARRNAGAVWNLFGKRFGILSCKPEFFHLNRGIPVCHAKGNINLIAGARVLCRVAEHLADDGYVPCRVIQMCKRDRLNGKGTADKIFRRADVKAHIADTADTVLNLRIPDLAEKRHGALAHRGVRVHGRRCGGA